MGYNVGAVLQSLILHYLSHYAWMLGAQARAEYREYPLQNR